jgi:PIN domain nuclease of toxin-antitoxin system
MKRPKRSGAAGRSAHLLDTSTLLWALAEPERLSARVRRLVAAGENRATELTSARVRNIRPAHITALAALPMLHKDPFDRILIAQAKAEGLGLVTNDGPVGEYPIQTIW